MVETGEAEGVQLLAFESPVAGDHEQLVPPDPESGVDRPAQIVAELLATAVGRELTVTVALPEDVPGPFASDTEVTVYVVVKDGLTLRVPGLAVRPLCVTLSDQVIDQGGVPVRAAWIVVDVPAQIVAVPVTVAVAAGAVEMKTVDDRFPVHPFASVAVTVKLKVPPEEGVPESTPAGLSDSPAGSEADRTPKVYGAVPPEAVRVWL